MTIPVVGLLSDGRARVSSTWELDGPLRAGLWWRVPGCCEAHQRGHALFGGAADQPMASLPLRRALAATAARVEGDLGAKQDALPPIDPEDLAVSWRPGLQLQTQGADARGDS